MTIIDILGRTEEVLLSELDVRPTYARVDTGAKTSAIWVSQTELTDDGLKVVFYGPESPLYTGSFITFKEFSRTVVASSNGHAQKRFKVRLLITVRKRKIRAWFTLADRSTQVYPLLIGRNILRNKFIVDVTKFAPALQNMERKRTEALRREVSS